MQNRGSLPKAMPHFSPGGRFLIQLLALLTLMCPGAAIGTAAKIAIDHDNRRLPFREEPIS